jgi:hypothetical protein
VPNCEILPTLVTPFNATEVEELHLAGEPASAQHLGILNRSIPGSQQAALDFARPSSVSELPAILEGSK